jgi:hypothetical protein
MDKTIVKTVEEYDFLALVPQLVGFLPEQSMVLVAFRGKRTCGAIRFNLPDPGVSLKVHKRIATTLIGTLCKIPGVDSLVPVVYTNDQIGAEPGLPHSAFTTALMKRAEMSGFTVKNALCVAADGWGSYFDSNLPTGGHPLADIAASMSPEDIPVESRRQLGRLESRADLPVVGLLEKERFARLLLRFKEQSWTLADQLELLDLGDEIYDPVVLPELALEWMSPPLDQNIAAVLICTVQSPPIRDQVMLQFAFGKDVGEDADSMNRRYAMIEATTGATMDEIVRDEMKEAAETGVSAPQISQLLMGYSPDRPDPERIGLALDVLREATALAPKSYRPAPLCMLAWLSWALGRGSVAGLYIDQALAIDPKYSMALLLDTLFSSGHLPDWAYAVPEDDN